MEYWWHCCWVLEASTSYLPSKLEQGVVFEHPSLLHPFLCFSFQVTARSETPINSVSNSLENVLHTSTHSIEESLPKRPSGKHSKGVSFYCMPTSSGGKNTCISVAIGIIFIHWKLELCCFSSGLGWAQDVIEGLSFRSIILSVRCGQQEMTRDDECDQHGYSAGKWECFLGIERHRALTKCSSEWIWYSASHSRNRDDVDSSYLWSESS